MPRLFSSFALTALFSALLFQSSMPAMAQAVTDRNVSEHIRLLLPLEREYLARDVILDLESCWTYTNRSLGEKLPRKVLIDIRWDESSSRIDPSTKRIIIGMRHPAAAANEKEFVLRNAARELARMGLTAEYRDGVVREESEFLLEGMSEILAREFARSTRSLTGAWVLAQLLDRMGQLGLKQQATWSTFSAGRHGLRSSAPGITFLLACRELFGRDKLVKLFEAIRTKSLNESISATFKSSSAAVEEAWLKKVREYPPTEEFTAGAEEEAPRLERSTYLPDNPRPGASVQFRFYIRRGANALLPEGLYFQDETSGRVAQASQPPEKNAGYSVVEFPIEAGRAPGNYRFKLVALDEGGNLRTWPGTYEVKP